MSNRVIDIPDRIDKKYHETIRQYVLLETSTVEAFNEYFREYSLFPRRIRTVLELFDCSWGELQDILGWR